MRVRLYELRLIAAFLCGLWAAVFVAVLVWYHPGGPADLAVSAATVLPVAIAGLAVAYPPLARGDRAAVVIGWLGILASLLLLPVVASVIQALAGTQGGAVVLPSAEAIYAGVLTLFATCLFAGLGVARRLLGETALRQRRLLAGLAIAIGLTVASTGVIGGAVVANGLALREVKPPASPYGPTDGLGQPPRCDSELANGPDARIHIEASATVDGHRRGVSTVEGARAGTDERWIASGIRDGRSFVRSFVRVGDRAWTRVGSGAWTLQPPRSGSPRPGISPTLDNAVVASALVAPRRVAAEDAGLSVIGGAPARHCRTLTTGPLALASFPELDWLAETATPGPKPELSDWRGQIDWWVFADGQLGIATIRVSGLPPVTWPGGGVQAVLQASLTALDREEPERIDAPAAVVP